MSYLFSFLIALLPVFAFTDPTPPQAPPHDVKEQIEKATDTLEKTVPSAFDAGGVKIVLTLFGLIAFLVIAGWALRRMTGARAGLFGGSKGIKILERKAISPKSVLYIIETEGKKVLISESQFEVRTLAHLSDEKIADLE